MPAMIEMNAQISLFLRHNLGGITQPSIDIKTPNLSQTARDAGQLQWHGLYIGGQIGYNMASA